MAKSGWQVPSYLHLEQNAVYFFAICPSPGGPDLYAAQSRTVPPSGPVGIAPWATSTVLAPAHDTEESHDGNHGTSR